MSIPNNLVTDPEIISKIRVSKLSQAFWIEWLAYVKNGKVVEIANLSKSEIVNKKPQVYLINLSIMPTQPTLQNPSQRASTITTITMRS